jgi:predicted enzyme related to lactoylglutathione lyase
MMTSELYCVTFDCKDLPRLADFWAAALDYAPSQVKADWIALRPRPGQHGPPLGFQQESAPKRQKDRLHLDIRAFGSVDEEVERMKGLGATYEQRVDNSDGSWHVVMHDPEDNEFCVIPR